MVVQHNLTAMNSNRMLGITTGAQAKSTEKLSSGYKINRAADDAAGLSISEKMRKQIRGLSQASLNAEDGISSVQTAEGALNEVQDMLQRMNELAVKAANGTMSENDRSYIQNEIDQLVTEIDRVSETTKFNETYLLKGDKSVEGSTDYQYKGVARATTTLYNAADGSVFKTAGSILGATDVANIGNYATKQAGKDKATTGAVALAEQKNNASVYYKYTASGNAKYVEIAAGKLTFDKDDKVTGIAQDALDAINAALDADGVATIANEGAFKTAVANIGALFADNAGAAAATDAKLSASKYSVNAGTTLYNANGTKAFGENELITADTYAVLTTDYYTTIKGDTTNAAATEADHVKADAYKLFDKDGNGVAENGIANYYKDGAYVGGLFDEDGKEITVASGEIANYVDTSKKHDVGALTLKLHVGADATENNQITVSIESMSADRLGLKENGKNVKVDGADDKNALAAIETIKEAIQLVSTQRSALGAVQNRLEHTIANLDNVVENTTAAESQIRDTDMASEMVKFSNNNILAQAGQSMLAQANQSNQGVLSLLG